MRQRDNTANNPKVTVKAKIDFRNYTGIITNVCVLAKQVGTEASLGNINPTNVTVTYQAAEHLFRVAGKTPGQVSLARSNEWEWVVTHVNEVELKKPFPFCTSGVHRVYTIFGEPEPPWDNTYGSPQNAWVTALDFAILTNNCNGANSTHTALANITSYLHSGHGLTYDTDRGSSVYIELNGAFNMTKYINKANKNIVNCYDQAGGVYVTSSLLGIPSEFVFMGRTRSNGKSPFGYINVVNLVGEGLCNNPFYPKTSGGKITADPDAVDSAVRRSFVNHAFVRYWGLIYDACAGPYLGAGDLQQYATTSIDITSIPERQWSPDGNGSAWGGVWIGNIDGVFSAMEVNNAVDPTQHMVNGVQ